MINLQKYSIKLLADRGMTQANLTNQPISKELTCQRGELRWDIQTIGTRVECFKSDLLTLWNCIANNPSLQTRVLSASVPEIWPHDPSIGGKTSGCHSPPSSSVFKNWVCSRDEGSSAISYHTLLAMIQLIMVNLILTTTQQQPDVCLPSVACLDSSNAWLGGLSWWLGYPWTS